MSFTFTTSGAVRIASGARSKFSNLSGSQLDDWSDKVESVICDIARFDLVTNYTSLNTVEKKILGDLEDAMVAQKVIAYDMSNYIDSREAETLLDIHQTTINRNVDLIKDDKVKTRIKFETGG